MKPLEEFLKPTQKGLFKILSKMYEGKAISRKGKFILVKGEAPIMLLAHLDTVHQEPVREICKSPDGNILMSPQGIGGDDRCGVYALVNAYDMSPQKPWLLFTCDEEIGGVGATKFCYAYEAGKLPKELEELKLLIEIDRKGSNDAVYYDCDNKDFESYITSKGFKTAFGSFSDISLIAPELGVAAVNLSSGYYNAHSLNEYINRKELNSVLAKVIEIIDDAAQPNFPKYEYIERVYHVRNYTKYYNCDPWGEEAIHYYGQRQQKLDADPWEDWEEENFSKELPSEYHGIYEELLELHDAEELENLRSEYGNQILYQIYIDEYGLFYPVTNEK